LALRNGSFQGIVMVDLVAMVEAFEQGNSVRIALRAELTTWKGQRDIQWTAEAYEQTLEHSGALPLVYVSVRCMERRLATMEAVLMHLLYALDFQLAEREFKALGEKGQ
jgi:hypothetical protein